MDAYLIRIRLDAKAHLYTLGVNYTFPILFVSGTIMIISSHGEAYAYSSVSPKSIHSWLVTLDGTIRHGCRV